MQVDEAKNDIWAQRITLVLTRLLLVVSGHWLAVTAIVLGLYAWLPLSAPLLAYGGREGAADVIHLLYRPFCHQLPERSFFFFGPQYVYTYAELSAALGGEVVPPRWTGSAAVGWKTAFCQRDVAIYLTMWFAALGFGLVRRHLRPLPFRWFIAFLVPMAVDGLGQLFGLWTSTALSRVLTGAFFGVACIWLVFPYLEEGMRDARRQAERTLYGMARD